MAVLFAYVSRALDEKRLNYLDLRVVYFMQNTWYRTLPGRRESMASLAASSDIEEVRHARKEGLLQFILTLSDQQLVTGLAIRMYCFRFTYLRRMLKPNVNSDCGGVSE